MPTCVGTRPVRGVGWVTGGRAVGSGAGGNRTAMLEDSARAYLLPDSPYPSTHQGARHLPARPPERASRWPVCALWCMGHRWPVLSSLDRARAGRLGQRSTSCKQRCITLCRRQGDLHAPLPTPVSGKLPRPCGVLPVAAFVPPSRAVMPRDCGLAPPSLVSDLVDTRHVVKRSGDGAQFTIEDVACGTMWSVYKQLTGGCGRVGTDGRAAAGPRPPTPTRPTNPFRLLLSAHELDATRRQLLQPSALYTRWTSPHPPGVTHDASRPIPAASGIGSPHCSVSEGRLTPSQVAFHCLS